MWAVELYDEQGGWYLGSMFGQHANARAIAFDMVERTRRWTGVALRTRIVRARPEQLWFPRSR
jgi:hypothetical protein